MRVALGIVILWTSLVCFLREAPCEVAPDLEAFVEGRFGTAIDLSTHGRHVVISLGDSLATSPIAFECWVKLYDLESYNIIMAVSSKKGKHWEVYTVPRTGALALYIPQVGDFRSNHLLQRHTWHHLAVRLGEKSVELYADGQAVVVKDFPERLVFDRSPLLLGKVEGESLHMLGAIDELKISRRTDDLARQVPSGRAAPDDWTLAIFHFDDAADKKEAIANAMGSESNLQASMHDDLTIPTGSRFLDEVQDEAYADSTLHGDAHVEWESRLEAHPLQAESSVRKAICKPPARLSLNGEWLLKEAKPRQPAGLEQKRIHPQEGEGVQKRWFQQGFDRSDWRRVQVPTTVQSALLKLGEIADPLYGAETWNELHKYGAPAEWPWYHRRTRIEQSEWWFARTFTLPQEWRGKRLRLYFDGIDYAASVYLNGRPLGYHAGMFGGPSIDVSRAVSSQGENELVVRLDSPPETWSGVPKGSPGWGWHYGHLISVGIWRDVEIGVVPDVEIISPFVKTIAISDDSATLQVEYYIANHASEAARVEVAGTIEGMTFSSGQTSFTHRIVAPPGQSRYRGLVSASDCRPWWPLNYGEPHLYGLSLVVSAAGSEEPLDGKQVKFGIRTIEMQPLRGAKEEVDYRWQFIINGVPMFIKGANWCWSDPLLQLDPARYAHLLELARRAGIQMFRCWGGGIVETDEFYRLCDAKGIMVYQEFPYCWGPPDFPLTDAAVLDQQVTRVVKRLRNHPSLVMWGGGNENLEIRGSDEALFLVGRRCRQYDPSRPFHRTSPWGGSFHNWRVFHGGMPIDSGFMGNPAPWYGEFGLPSMTNRDETMKYLPQDRLEAWPPAGDDGAILSHMNQFSLRDIVKVFRYAAYGPIGSWDQYAEYSQMAQGDEIMFATNLQRAGSYLNKGGLWFYKMTDLFPGHSWAVVGYYGHPKLAYYRARQAYSPQAAFAHYPRFDWRQGEAFRASIHVSNDSSKPIAGAIVTVVIYGSDLAEQWRKTYSVPSMGKSSRVELDRIEVELDPARLNPFVLAVSMRAADGALISDQWYWFNFMVKSDAVRRLEELDAWTWPLERVPEAFKAYAELREARLLTLPRTRLSASVQRDGRHGLIKVGNETNIPAFNVLVDRFPHGYGAFLEDNSFFLYPQERREIRFEFADEAYSLDELTVRAWNADAVRPAAGS